MNLVYLNGSYLPQEEACLPVADRSLAYGDGVFTTMKVSGGVPQFLRKHLERLTRDAAAIRLAAPVGEVEAACFGVVSRLGLKDGVIKWSFPGEADLVGSRRGTSRDRASL